jgi:hypothetical protein
MLSIISRRPALLGAVATLLAGCSLDSGDPSTPSTVVAASNSTLTAKTNTPVGVGVYVFNQFQEPIQGATVTYTVTGGTGTLSAATKATDLQGFAQNSFVPTKAGTSTITASVGGLRALTFTVVAADSVVAVRAPLP